VNLTLPDPPLPGNKPLRFKVILNQWRQADSTVALRRDESFTAIVLDGWFSA